jgi:hypothetical protein
VNTPKPGDFPIGSVESRAAMRLQITEQGSRPHLAFISYVPRPWRGNGPEPKDWNKVPRLNYLADGWCPQDGRVSDKTQCLYVPPNMTDDEARKIVGLGKAKVTLVFGGRR